MVRHDPHQFLARATRVRSNACRDTSIFGALSRLNPSVKINPHSRSAPPISERVITRQAFKARDLNREELMMTLAPASPKRHESFPDRRSGSCVHDA